MRIGSSFQKDRAFLPPPPVTLPPVVSFPDLDRVSATKSPTTKPPLLHPTPGAPWSKPPLTCTAPGSLSHNEWEFPQCGGISARLWAGMASHAPNPPRASSRSCQNATGPNPCRVVPGTAGRCCFPWSEPHGEPLEPAHAAPYRAVRSRIAHAPPTATWLRRFANLRALVVIEVRQRLPALPSATAVRSGAHTGSCWRSTSAVRGGA